eukprot:CAMPEP_0171104774 /NCGR_PEP_ID=MMETSP0766_2-20121228/61310_1 /TAXON_ID=439317 /ORGANISM="Gambierdiscus australes, Strain CAWD 149" /LENGTH=156 /DNA_ID=CAMNT_0011565459 /DNA_START=43 /DNA_END=509 /DNA_ORIENTATION=+
MFCKSACNPSSPIADTFIVIDTSDIERERQELERAHARQLGQLAPLGQLGQLGHELVEEEEQWEEEQRARREVERQMGEQRRDALDLLYARQQEEMERQFREQRRAELDRVATHNTFTGMNDLDCAAWSTATTCPPHCSPGFAGAERMLGKPCVGG